MAVKLKDVINGQVKFYGESVCIELVKVVKNVKKVLTYDDLISEKDREFWGYLCRKDFRRLDKLMTHNIGEGHFLDDSGEDDTEEDEAKPEDSKEAKSAEDNANDNQGDSWDEYDDAFKAQLELMRDGGMPTRTTIKGAGDDEDAENDGADYGARAGEQDWMKITPEDKLDKTQSRLKDLRRQLQEESEAQQKTEEREKQLEHSKYQDNNFWKVDPSSEGAMTDAQLLADLDN